MLTVACLTSIRTKRGDLAKWPRSSTPICPPNQSRHRERAELDKALGEQNRALRHHQPDSAAKVGQLTGRSADHRPRLQADEQTSSSPNHRTETGRVYAKSSRIRRAHHRPRRISQKIAADVTPRATWSPVRTMRPCAAEKALGDKSCLCHENSEMHLPAVIDPAPDRTHAHYGTVRFTCWMIIHDHAAIEITARLQRVRSARQHDQLPRAH